jgi:hypothetical protein
VLGDVRGLDVVGPGCGTAYFSAWLARPSARPAALGPFPGAPGLDEPVFRVGPGSHAFTRPLSTTVSG